MRRLFVLVAIACLPALGHCTATGGAANAGVKIPEMAEEAESGVLLARQELAAGKPIVIRTYETDPPPMPDWMQSERAIQLYRAALAKHGVERRLGGCLPLSPAERAYDAEMNRALQRRFGKRFWADLDDEMRTMLKQDAGQDRQAARAGRRQQLQARCRHASN